MYTVHFKGYTGQNQVMQIAKLRVHCNVCWVMCKILCYLHELVLYHAIGPLCSLYQSGIVYAPSQQHKSFFMRHGLHKGLHIFLCNNSVFICWQRADPCRTVRLEAAAPLLLEPDLSTADCVHDYSHILATPLCIIILLNATVFKLYCCMKHCFVAGRHQGVL